MRSPDAPSFNCAARAMADARRSFHRERSGAVDPPSPKDALRDCLASFALPPGLLSSVMRSYHKCESRLVLIDNSSAMKVHDSHVGRLVNQRGTGGAILESVDNVTRWEELQECIAFQCRMASKCWIPTKFWLVNEDPAAGHKFSLCWGSHEDVPDEMATIKRAMTHASLDKEKCPLTRRIHMLAKGIAHEEPYIRARDTHVTLVICTQGMPTDSHGDTSFNVRRELQIELAKLSDLPVKVIVRLCTDDEGVRDMFNTMDGKFDSIDVLDDYWGEAIEVFLHNPWLTYGMGLHRLREAGLAPGVIDDIDEQPLSLDEIHELCTLLFVGDDGCINLPHPRNGWDNFVRALQIVVDKEELQWNPVKKRIMPWIDIAKLESIHGRRHRVHRHPKDSHTPPREPKSPSMDHSDRSDRSDPSRRHSYHPSADRDRHAQEKQPRRATAHPKQQRRRSSQQSKDPPQERGHSSHGHQRAQQRQSTFRRSTYSSTAGVAQQRRSVTFGDADSSAGKDLTLTEVLARWSHQPPSYDKSYNSLQHLLVRVPFTFPPMNTKVESHEYFAKWKSFDEEAFADVDGDELKELLKRAVRKAKFFLHPDKLPKDLTENQTLLFKTIWNAISEQETATLG